MTIKDVIAQAEDRFEEKFPDMNISQRTAPPVYLPNAPRKMLKEFIFSTYTKDLLQSVQVKLREEVEGKFGVEQMMALGNFQKALSDIIEEIK